MVNHGSRSSLKRRIMTCSLFLCISFLLFKITRPRARECVSEAREELKQLLYVRIIEDIVQRFVANNVSFMIYGSTLLGSFRHHGLLPYSDTAIDFAVNVSHLPIVEDILQERNNNTVSFNLTSDGVDAYNLFKCKLDGSGPVIRISHFMQVDNFIIFSKGKMPLSSDLVFPMTHRPFLKVMLPVPACSGSVLKNLFDMNSCCSFNVDYRPLQCVKCSTIRASYAFVESLRYTDDVVQERLWKGGRSVAGAIRLKQSLCLE